MTARRGIFRFETEAAMCAAYIRDADRQGWDAYPETCGFDIVLVHREIGVQIGVEAKQQFNSHVILQALDGVGGRAGDAAAGPDFRAVLAPAGGDPHLCDFAARLGVAVVRACGEPDGNGMARLEGGGRRAAFSPGLPEPWQIVRPENMRSYWWRAEHDWPQHFPQRQLPLPDYVPDVPAGAAAPVALTEWKVRAIKLRVLLDRRGWLTAGDFRALNVSTSRWFQGRWVVRQGGVWVLGPHMPDFRAQHPRNYDEIAADFEAWSGVFPDPGAGGPLFEQGRAS